MLNKTKIKEYTSSDPVTSLPY